ncbi:hypothetical protein WOLCODRAFT_161996 [Wolfiporia cocos MD-104 SS10]|uniref:NAD(P)-binding protein n=1 Tax=Wolfiporia cocos (strain MD-104) TaxID=742152 RepID=A0A2H3JQE9_WOLCO|nr:hypothetical protein WOLCODRAFT_161996 [Wolfiporia cocos MD-104 SS10]
MFNILLIGAGEINFGSVEGPWNHSLRLEQVLGADLRVVGLVDPDVTRARAALDGKLAGPTAPAYASCKVFPSVAAAAAGGELAGEASPRVAIVGAPPFVRGSDLPGKDLELQLVSAFSECALFVEKPVSSGAEEACWRVTAELQKKGTLVGVGYMLRYSKAVQRMKQIVRENKLVVMGTNARYVMAYEYARKLASITPASRATVLNLRAVMVGQNVLRRPPPQPSSSKPPISARDLSRYFGGDVSLPSVAAHTVEHDDAPGALSAQRFDEGGIPPARRLPRLTSATWKYKGGAVGALTHVIALHGTTYDTEFEVYADGFRLKLVDPYGSPVLSVRRPGLAGEELISFTDDDPFYTELSTFVEAVKDPKAHGSILSSYEDAVKTYELTWHIRRASEASTAAERERTAQAQESNTD